MKNKIEKYVDLLLKSLKVEEKSYLFIEIPNYLSDFILILKEAVKKYDLEDVYFHITDPYKKHELMSYLDQENINKHPMFDLSIFNKYAKLDAAFLFIHSMIPKLMEDVKPEVIKETVKHERETQKYFRDLYERSQLYWCIACVPNEEWASKGLGMSLEEMWETVFNVCLVSEDNDPYQDWCFKLDKMEENISVLNQYQFEYLKYKNALGTDLTVYLPKKHVWCSGRGIHGEICNMPTEEIFTSPQYTKTEGVVYASKPLFYNEVMIEEIYLKFSKGRVIEYNAKSGKEVLKTILEMDDYSSYLGECALVSYDSPISNTGILFKTTLYDENASCHLALGMGFSECLKDGENLKASNLQEMGVNDSKVHVDFMIGTDDLEIVGVTAEGKEITIMADGNLRI